MLRSVTMGLLAVTFIYAAMLPCLAADGAPVSVSFEAFEASKYVWRGIVCNDEPVLQPSLTASWPSGVSFNVWSSFNHTDCTDAKGKCSELDYTLGYAWESAGKALSLSYCAYTFPNTAFPDTSEVIASCGFGGSWGTTLTLNQDIDEADGTYLNLGVARSVQIGGRSVDISGGLGYADKHVASYYYGAPSAGLSDASVCIKAPINCRGSWSITPSIAYSRVLRQPLRDAVGDPDNFVFGIKLARSF